MAREAKPATNGFNSDLLRGYITRVENMETEIGSVMGTAMREVKTLRDDIKEILAEAKENGIAPKALKAELKLRKLDRDKNKVMAGLAEEDADTLELIQEALGDFASSPLGAAAVTRAEFKQKLKETTAAGEAAGRA
jgi:uncharacterized protein (UPF0335 family)